MIVHNVHSPIALMIDKNNLTRLSLAIWRLRLQPLLKQHVTSPLKNILLKNILLKQQVTSALKFVKNIF